MKATFVIAGHVDPWGDSSTICSSRQVSTDRCSGAQSQQALPLIVIDFTNPQADGHLSIHKTPEIRQWLAR